MKKILLGIMMAAGLTAAAQSMFDGETLYGWNNYPYNSLWHVPGRAFGQAIRVSADNLKELQGCKITGLAVANGKPMGSSGATEFDITLFTGGSEINTDDYSIPGTTEWQGQMDLTKPFEYKVYPLPTPIEVTESTEPFFAGYYCYSDTSKCASCILDRKYHEEGQGWGFIGFSNDIGGAPMWSDWSRSYGYGCIRLVVEGTGMPANKVSVRSYNIPSYSAPGSEIEVKFAITNNAYNEVSDVTLKYWVGDQELSQKFEFENPLLFNYYTDDQTLKLTLPETESKNLRLDFEVAAINGEAVNQADEEARTFGGSILVIDPTKGVERAVVVEEATGTWCGWCPRGIVGLDKMAAEFPETFIPIAVHINDAMSANSYSSLSSLTGGGAPSSLVNRDKETFGIVDPNYDDLKAAYEKAQAIPSFVSVKLTNVEQPEGKKRLNLTTEVMPVMDIDAQYLLAYVITEDQVGPYMQVNSYSGYTGQMDGWGDKEGYVETMYDHVARYIKTFNGVKESLPSEMKAGETYTHETYISTSAVSNLANCCVIALVINSQNGIIENACSVKVGADSAIPTIETTSDPAQWYDLQGRPVTTPSHGIFIKKQGNSTEKIKL